MRVANCPAFTADSFLFLAGQVGPECVPETPSFPIGTDLIARMISEWKPTILALIAKRFSLPFGLYRSLKNLLDASETVFLLEIVPEYRTLTEH